MNPIGKKISELAAVLLACALFGFVPFSQAAQPVSGTPATLSFDHTKTGFLLRDVHATLRCEQCHVDGIFKNTPRDCAGCHATGTRVGATPKPVNHVQTIQPCDACHTSPTSFLVKSFKHTGIVDGCSSCHNNQSLGVVSKPVNHFPTLLPCESCHTNTGTFLAWRMDHTGQTTGCVVCHGNTPIYPHVTSKPILHIATTDPCESCHTVSNTLNFTTFLGAKYNHSTVAFGSCVNCHNGANAYAGAQGQSAAHIPDLGATCDTCHTQTNDFTTWTSDTYNHINPVPTAKCTFCHNGSYTAYYAQGVNAGHTPTLGAQCDTCHTPSNTSNFTTFLGAGVNHTTLVPPPAGRCSSSGCHDGSGLSLGAQALSSFPAHIATNGAQCDTCHTPAVTQNYTTFLGALLDHSTITPPVAGRCSTCHNGTAATGMTVGHVATTAQCDTCHKTQIGVSWLGALFHANAGSTPVTGVCGGSGCHDGSANGVAQGATGKPSVHLATTGINCDSCHTVASTKNFSTWLGATFTHGSAQVGVCQTCHDGTQALGKSVPHIPTTAGASCDSAGCHTNLASVYNVASNAGLISAWGGASYGHAGVVAGSCATCHNGSYPGVTSQSNCYGSASACPQGATYSHPATSAPCDQCHTSALSVGYTTWANAGHSHSATTDAGKCSTAACHGSIPGASGGAGKPMTTNHVPLPSGQSCDASGCHSSAYVASPTFTGGNLVHTFYSSSTCVSCHTAGMYPGFGTGTAVPKVSNHIPTTITGTLDCNTCHKGTPPNTAAGAAAGATVWATGEAMNHNSAQGMGAGGVYCVNCHLSGVTYLGKMQKKSHNGASTSKDCSSSSCHIPLGKKGKAYTSWN